MKKAEEEVQKLRVYTLCVCVFVCVFVWICVCVWACVWVCVCAARLRGHLRGALWRARRAPCSVCVCLCSGGTGS